MKKTNIYLLINKIFSNAPNLDIFINNKYVKVFDN